MDSGFLYFTTTFVHFVVWFTPNDLAIRVASGIVSECLFVYLIFSNEKQNIPTIGIAFNLILIRVGQNRAWEQTKSAGNRSGHLSSNMRYATNSILSQPKHDKIMIDISQETSVSTVIGMDQVHV